MLLFDIVLNICGCATFKRRSRDAQTVPIFNVKHK